MRVLESPVYGLCTVTQGSIRSVGEDAGRLFLAANTNLSLWDIKEQFCVWSRTLHEESITSVRWFPSDPTRFLTAAFDGKIRCWDAVTYSLLFELCQDEHIADALEINKSGTEIGVCLRSKMLQRWKVHESQFELIHQYADYYFVDCNWTENEQLIALGNTKDSPSKHFMFVFGKDTEPIMSIDLSSNSPLTCLGMSFYSEPEGKPTQFFGVGRKNGKIHLFDALKVEQIAVVRETGPYARLMGIDAHGTIYTENSDSSIACIARDGSLKSLETNLATGSVRNITVDASGKYLWLGNETYINRYTLPFQTEGDESLIAFDLIEMHSIHRHHLASCGVSFNASGDQLCSGDLKGNLYVWKKAASSGSPPVFSSLEHTFHHRFSAGIRSCFWAADDPLSNLTNQKPKDISMWDFVTKDIEPEHRQSESQSGRIFVGTFDGKVYTIDDVTSAIDLVLDCFDTVTCIRALKHFVAACDTKGKLAILDAQKRVLSQFNICQDEIWSITWLSKGYIAMGCEDQTTKIFDTNKGTVVLTLRTHSMAVTCVDYQPHKSLGHLLATSSDDRTVCLFRLGGLTDEDSVYDSGKETQESALTAELISTFRTNGLYVTYCAIQPKGDYVACTTLDGFVYVWDMLTGALQVRRKRHIGSIEGISFTSADVGNCVATTGSDCTVSVLQFAP